MTNHNESTDYNREVTQNSYTDADGNTTHTNVTRTSETVENDPSSYQDGYASGKIQERNDQRRNLAARDSNNATGGLLLGIMLAALATLVGGAMWYFNQSKEAQNATPTPIESPVTNTEPNQPEANQPQNNTTTIIEKTKEVAVPVEVPVAVPVPQQQEPAQESQQPDININVQPQEPQEGASESDSTPPEQTTPKQPQTSNGSTNNSSQSQEPQKQTNPTTSNPSTSDSNSSSNPE